MVDVTEELREGRVPSILPLHLGGLLRIKVYALPGEGEGIPVPTSGCGVLGGIPFPPASSSKAHLESPMPCSVSLHPPKSQGESLPEPFLSRGQGPRSVAVM